MPYVITAVVALLITPITRSHDPLSRGSGSACSGNASLRGEARPQHTKPPSNRQPIPPMASVLGSPLLLAGPTAPRTQ